MEIDGDGDGDGDGDEDGDWDGRIYLMQLSDSLHVVSQYQIQQFYRCCPSRKQSLPIQYGHK